MGIKGAAALSRSALLYNPFRQSSVQQPFLSPLGKPRRSLPAMAMPLTVIIIGGGALVVASSVLFSGIAIKSTDSVDMAVAATPSIEEQATAPAQILSPDDQPAQTATLPAPAATTAAPETQALSFNAPDVSSGPSNEAELAILDVIEMPPVEEEAEPSASAQDESEAPLTVAQAASAGQNNAVTNGAVNLRAAADKDAEILLVVPKNVSIEAQENCTWCAVTYQGSQGYIYKSFIDYR